MLQASFCNGLKGARRPSRRTALHRLVPPQLSSAASIVAKRPLTGGAAAGPISTTSPGRQSCLVSARGVDFHVELLNPIAPQQVLCMAGALGTASTDFGAQLDGGGLDEVGGEREEEIGLVAFDPRGLGKSISAGSRDYPRDFYLRDALDGAAIMDALGLLRYSVLGWSDGANAAVHLAAHDADTSRLAVEKLIVWGGNSYVTKEDIGAYEAVRDVRLNWSDRAREEKAAVHGGVENLQALNDAFTDAMRDLYYDRGGDVCRDELRRVRCPTLVLHGQLDIICHESHAWYMAQEIPGAKLRLFPEGKHNLHQRHHTEFRTVVRNFLLSDGDGGHKE